MGHSTHSDFGIGKIQIFDFFEKSKILTLQMDWEGDRSLHPIFKRYR